MCDREGVFECEKRERESVCVCVCLCICVGGNQSPRACFEVCMQRKKERKKERWPKNRKKE